MKPKRSNFSSASARATCALRARSRIEWRVIDAAGALTSVTDQVTRALGQSVSVPWLDKEMASLRAAFEADRMPHALLIHEGPRGRRRVARPLDCPAAPAGPSGISTRIGLACIPSRNRARSASSRVRELAQELALTSHQGGYKVGVISPADVLNRFAANALLKTLEEPSPRTVLILVVTQPSRLPATILSRCQRIRIPAPDRSQSVSWLETTRGKGDWKAVLDIVGERHRCWPRSRMRQAVVQIGAEVRRGLEEAAAEAPTGGYRGALGRARSCRCGSGALRTGSRNAFAAKVAARPF